MNKKKNQYLEIVRVLQELHKNYPTYNIGRHLATAFADYGDMWALSDKEFLFALEKYKAELEMNIVSDDDIIRVIEDTDEIFSSFPDEEDDLDY